MTPTGWRAPSVVAAATLATTAGRVVSGDELLIAALALPPAWPQYPPATAAEAVTDLLDAEALAVWGVTARPARLVRRAARPIEAGEAPWLARSARRHGVVLTVDPGAPLAAHVLRAELLPVLTTLADRPAGEHQHGTNGE